MLSNLSGVISFDFWYLSLFNKKKQELEMCSKDTDAYAWKLKRKLLMSASNRDRQTNMCNIIGPFHHSSLNGGGIKICFFCIMLTMILYKSDGFNIIFYVFMKSKYFWLRHFL